MRSYQTKEQLARRDAWVAERAFAKGKVQGAREAVERIRTRIDQLRVVYRADVKMILDEEAAR